MIVPWNDAEALARGHRRARARGDHAEPVPANMGVVPAEPRLPASCCAERPTNGALLIFDEVITGFRVARGGAQERYGVDARPDDHGQDRRRRAARPPPTAGRRELMERIAPAGDVYQAGTLSGNPLAVAAGLATLGQLDDDAYERLAATTDALAAGLREAAAARGPSECRSRASRAC